MDADLFTKQETLRLLKAIRDYTPSHEVDAAAKCRIEAFLKSSDTPFGKLDESGHITVSAFVVDEAFEKVLLTHHKKLDKWLQLGGHTDLGEHVAEGALREAREESGLTEIIFVMQTIFDLDVHQLPEYKGTPEHDHHDIRYLMMAKASDRLSISEESKDLKWVALEDIQQYTTEPSMLRMVEKLSKYK